ncbi:MAG TPA: TonB-dependent receptor [Pyrinomonadaceae bacterium]|nr:TonB-dependent receptor [Pyrinomonadaceae bacterium]
MFSNHHRLVTVITILALLTLCAVANGQTITGSISGTVTDLNGAVVPGAVVTLTSDTTTEKRSATTDSEGHFSFTTLQPGNYSLKVERQNFQALEQKGVVLSANEKLAVGDLKLQPGQVTETVSVTSEGAIVERESSDLTARLTSDQISLISTKGRDITSLLRLIPGTSNNDDIEAVGEGFGTDLPNISGQRGRSTVASIDGLNAAEPSGSNKVSMTISQDAVAEVKVLRNNYGAEYGNNGGALINIVSKGGTKDYRGSAYYFLRNEALNATNFFTNKAGLPRPLYRHNIWGFNVSGPMPVPRFGEGGKALLRNKVFFFVNIERPHTITPTDPVFVTVPTELERKGDFSKSVGSNGSPVTVIDPLTGSQFPGNVIPDTRWNSSGRALLNFFPVPNTPGGKTLAGAAFNYVNQQSVDVPKHSYVFRFDIKPSNKDNVYWKGQWWTSDNVGLGTSGWPGGDNNRWGINSHYLYKDNGWSANWIHIFGPAVVNEFNIGMRHDSEGFIPGDGVIERLTRSAVGYTSPQIFPENNHLGTIPRVTGWSGVAGTPANINWLDRWGEIGNDYIQPSFGNNLSISHGDHTLKFGTYYERLKNGEAPGGQWSGVFNFDNNSAFTTALGGTGYPYANALLGNFRTYTESSARPFTNLGLTIFQWYGQDEWRVNRKLSLNYGMRFGYHTPFAQFDRQGSNFDPSLYDPSKAAALWLPICHNGTAIVPITATACATGNRRAYNPVTGQIDTNVNLVGTFVPGANLTNGLAIGTDPNTPEGYRTTKPIDFEPRVGLAFDLFGTGKTVIRTMAGVYHSQRVGGGTTGGNLVNNPPANRSFAVGPCLGCNINNLANVINGALISPPSVNAVEVESHTPTIYNFTFGVQQDIGFKTVLEVQYVGSLARHLGERRNINQIADGTAFIDAKANCSMVVGGVVDPTCRRNPFSNTSIQIDASGLQHTFGAASDNFFKPYKGYGDINQVTWSGTSNYNALQVQLNRRYTRGFNYGLAYTWSKTFDYANDDSSDVALGRPYKAFNYGPADFDQTHIFTINYIYDIPSLSRHWNNGFVRHVLDNWQVSGITSYASGKPKTGVSAAFNGGTYSVAATDSCAPGFVKQTGSTTVCTSTTVTNFTGGEINARPVVTCDPNQSAGTDPTGTAYVIDPTCFAKPSTFGSIGNYQRNLVRMPSVFNTDIAFFKNFPLGENRSIQLRWETYNLFNRANFRDIDGAMTFGINTTTSAKVSGACPSGTTALAGTANLCAGPQFGQLLQTNTRFGAPTSARAPRVMQASIRVNF